MGMLPVSLSVLYETLLLGIKTDATEININWIESTYPADVVFFVYFHDDDDDEFTSLMQ